MSSIIPGLSMPFNCALRIPSAVNIHPKRYLQVHFIISFSSSSIDFFSWFKLSHFTISFNCKALFLACQNLAMEDGKEIHLLQKSFDYLREFAGGNDTKNFIKSSC